MRDFRPGAKMVFISVWPVLKSLPQIGMRQISASSTNAGISTVKFGAPFANGTPDFRAAYAYIIEGAIRGSLSYITGAHSFKTGFSNMSASSSMFTYLISQPLTYRFNNGVPNQFTEYALPSTADSNIDADFGLFAQDKWTHGRMTLSGGVRFDYFKTSFPEMRLGPTQ